jgi:hypothetical protein
MDDGTARIELRRRNAPSLWALIDESNRELVEPYNWQTVYAKHTFYVRGYVPGSDRKRFTLLHRLILDAPKGVEVDHRNGNGLDNRRSNLRLATRSQNRANVRAVVNGSSRYKGVTRHKGAWQADIANNYIGRFSTEEAAARAYDAEALARYGPEWACLNFPEEGVPRSAARDRPA